MLQIAPALQVAQTIQLALAPVFLLAGIGTFLNVCTGRLARVIDRARKVEHLVLETRGKEHDRLVAEIRVLDRRMTVVNTAILLGVASAGTVCLVVILLFLSGLVDAHLGEAIAILFMIAMLLLALAFTIFILEIRLASRTIHIRNEVLYHRADGDEP
jgi:hypothetical protein